jgi:hypothetical protein
VEIEGRNKQQHIIANLASENSSGDYSQLPKPSQWKAVLGKSSLRMIYSSSDYNLPINALQMIWEASVLNTLQRSQLR